MQKRDYLLGRFSGALLVSCLVFIGPALGILIGSFMPWLDPARLGPTVLQPYALGFLYLVLPNLFCISAVFFTLASLTRSWLWTYLGVIIFFTSLLLANAFSGDLESEYLGSLLNPFGMTALGLQTRYWTVAESNTLLPEFAGALAANRFIWVALSLAVLAIGYFSFSYSRSVSIARKKKKKLDDVPEQDASTAGPKALPAMHPTFDTATWWRQIVRATRYETIEVLRSIPFLIILAFGLFNFIGGASFLDRIFGTRVYPVTHLMWQGIQGSYSFLLVIIITFYAGELVWRERSRQLKDVFDALPTANSVFLISKTAALLAVTMIFLATGVLAAIGIQLWNGYTNLELGLYAQGLLVYGLPFLLVAVLAVFLQVLSNSKFLGFMLMIVFMLSSFIFNALDWNHNIYNYAASPSTPYSDMNGWGHFVVPLFWFNLYWTFAALALAALAAVFWVRGREGAMRFRLRLAKQRLRGPARALLAASLVGFIACGTWIFYNTNILNDYVSGDEQEQQLADYEKQYRQYIDVPLPRIVAVNTDVDIYPYERRIEARGAYKLVNETDGPISELHMNLPLGVTFNELNLPQHEVRLADERLGYHIYDLAEPIEAGESFDITFDVTVEPQGFVNGGSDTSLVHNGTFFNNTQYFPSLGYSANAQIRDRNTRREYDLGPLQRMAKVDDLGARNNTYISNDSDWIEFETTVSTAADQIAIAPGYLQEERVEGDRRYFHYKMDAPILHFYSYLSARYEVLRDSWNDVAIEIYYHPGHEYNLDRMVQSIKDSLEYFSENFSPYQHRQMRIIEFPRYATFAQAFPNTVPFSESIGFIARLEEEPDSIDYVYYVTAHEVAHQWWAHQVIGGNVQGSTMLSETMAQYGALMVMEKKYGPEKMRRFLKYELDTYLRNRGGELVEEMPLMLVENQQYIHYNKGSVIMFALKEMLGEEVLNGAIASYVSEVAFQEPPFTHTPDFMAHIRAAAPPEMQDAISDMFERITLFENRVETATYTERDDGTYLVRLETYSSKLYADGEGNETDTELDDWIEIGVFGEKEVDGGSEETVLFLEKRHVQAEDGVFEVVVDEKPVRAGIDPFHRLVDRNSDNNLRSVKEADAEDSGAGDEVAALAPSDRRAWIPRPADAGRGRLSVHKP
ncbi:MAG: M1 family aminopeptidase, partial [Acidobacteriota bacterium]